MRSLLAGLLVVSAALFTTAAAQTPQSPSAPPLASSGSTSPSGPALTLKATTRMVVVDVVAADQQGRSVTDLKATDFALLENEHKETIRDFGFEQPATAPPALPAALKFKPGVFTNIQFSQEPKTLHMILLDALNTSMSDQMYVRQQMIRFLETMPAGQPIAVYTLNRSLRLLHDFTTDSDILKELARNYRAERSVIPDGPSAIVSPGALSGNPLSPGIQASLQSFLNRKEEFDSCNRVERTTLAVQTLARTLAGYPGRKNLIWISGVFPLMFFPENEQAILVCGRDRREMALKASSMLADTRIAVYPVDAVGLVADGLGVANVSYDEFGNSHVQGSAYGGLLARQHNDLAAKHFLMEELAARTGGKAFYNRNDLHTAFQRSITDGSSYYMLGYYPSDKNWNGAFRKVEVKLNRPDISLRYRPGYYAIDKQHDPGNLTASNREMAEALDLSTPLSTMLHFTATLMPPSADTANKLVVNYRINASSISFEQGTDGLRRAAVGCYVQAFSEDGRPVKAIRQLSDATLKPATYQRVTNEGFPCTTAIDLPAGKYQLRFAVRDERTGQLGTANGKVTIP
jgi:VWFA-related protein